MLLEITLVKLNGRLHRDGRDLILPSAVPQPGEGSGGEQWLHLAAYLTCRAVAFWVWALPVPGDRDVF